jgi:hypothetical protein
MDEPPKYADCPLCVHFRHKRHTPLCDKCGTGEHFEPRVRELDLSEKNLLRMMTRRKNAE